MVFEETKLTVSAGIAPNKVLFLFVDGNTHYFTCFLTVDACKGETPWICYKERVSNFHCRRFVQIRSASQNFKFIG